MALLEVENVKKTYKVRKFGNSYGLMAVNGVSFSLEKGKCMGLVGESGCGKSTLGRVLAGLEVPTEGRVLFHGKAIHPEKPQYNPRRLAEARDIQLIFQDSFDAVNPRFTARRIVEEPLKNLTNLSAKDRVKKIDELLNQVGISVSEKNKFGMEFSGGQLQRICIARALASNPELIILDEPLSSLDVSVQAQILNLLCDIKEELNLSYILISHDLEAVYYLADSLVVMYGGRIMEQIDDISMFNDMKHPYTRKLLTSIPAYKNAEKEQDEAETIWMDFGVQKEGFTGCLYHGRCPYETGICQRVSPKMREIEKGHFLACHNI